MNTDECPHYTQAEKRQESVEYGTVLVTIVCEDCGETLEEWFE